MGISLAKEFSMPAIVCQSALEAVSLIQSGETLWTHSMGATPRVLLDALAKHALTIENLTLLQLHTEGAESLSLPDLKGHLRHRCFFGDDRLTAHIIELSFGAHDRRASRASTAALVSTSLSRRRMS